MSAVELRPRRSGPALALAWVALLLPLLAQAMGLFEKNHPRVEEGLKAYEGGDYEGALKSFDEAKKELPSSATLEFNRGNALYKLKRLEEANRAYHRAMETDRADLKEKDYYNLGNVWAEQGNTKEAIAAYRKALTLDSKDEEARHNLEVMLRDKSRPPPPSPSPDGGTDGGSDGGSDGGTDGGSGDGGSGAGNRTGGDGGSDAGSDAGGDSNRPGQGDGDGGTGPQQPNRETGADAGVPPETEDAGWNPRDAQQEASDGGWVGTSKLNKQDAEKLLDAIKQDERNLQLWRFQQPKRTRRQNEKDW